MFSFANFKNTMGLIYYLQILVLGMISMAETWAFVSTKDCLMYEINNPFKGIPMIQTENMDDGIWHYIKKNNWKLILLNHQLIQETVIVKFQGNDLVILDDQWKEIHKLDYVFENDSIQLWSIHQKQNRIPTPLQQQLVDLLVSRTLRFDVADQTLNFYSEYQVVVMLGRLDR
jgi:hypothetical protein